MERGMSKPTIMGIDLAAPGADRTVIHLWPPEPEPCPMCGVLGRWTWAVAWYCGPVQDGASEGGYKAVCKWCHDRWAAWDDSLRYYGA